MSPKELFGVLGLSLKLKIDRNNKKLRFLAHYWKREHRVSNSYQKKLAKSVTQLILTEPYLVPPGGATYH